VARGAGNAEIAVRLGAATATVKAHVHALLRTTGATARAQLVVVAYEFGVVVPGRGPSADLG